MTGRDRLRELLDAVLDAEPSLTEMAAAAHSSPFHFGRQVTRLAGEAPMALRRRVELERAAWLLQRGANVTETAFGAGYDSVNGFSRAYRRAFGFAPSETPPASSRGHWLSAPNGIHFHSPTALYVDAAAGGGAGDPVLGILIRQDCEDVSALMSVAQSLSATQLHQVRLPGAVCLAWDGPEETLWQLLRNLVLAKGPWLAAIEGEDQPDLSAIGDLNALAEHHREVVPRWLRLLDEVDARGGWGDRIVDALCTPPESFVLCQVVAHVLTFSAHRRQVARWMLRDAGCDLSDPALDPDPITWHRRHSGGTT
ncbi:helix-turn-helix transcriptional regulator [Naumannella sp. ID2617S]|uniref:AraC family transcriptional regulator n=1 Tax=Enemella dayhoffiae TaxID=2016507 RepID=A0A255H994_9ACTN|nr:helix-turn-helix transcriptional regulator [Enemella dayhoffiae]NNG19617.1 helix-turn-helix transcriptional regulator [Naumannella sp. ID2617S]OYO24169.1 AraC family transcriptional regulator [Enemella dayhoffiae]